MPFGVLMTSGLAGLGLVKGLTVDKAKENRQRQLAAETQRYSPWTGMQAQAIQNADPLGSAMQGGFTGFSLGQGMQNQAAGQKFADSYMKNMDADTAYKTGLLSPGNPSSSPVSYANIADSRSMSRNPLNFTPYLAMSRGY